MLRTLKNILSHPITLALSTSLLLILSFPRFDLGFLAFAALVPLLFAIDGASLKKSFQYGYLSGVVFFAGTLYWFIHMSETSGIHPVLSYLAVVSLVLYLSLYFGIFTLGFTWMNKRGMSFLPLNAACLWVACEFIRDRFLGGFGWVILGHTQYTNLPFIQICDATGVFGVSFFVLFVNVLIKSILKEGWFRKQPRVVLNNILFIFTIVFAVTLYGHYRLDDLHLLRTMRAAVIQANISQKKKWDPREYEVNLKAHQKLTKEAMLFKPDLVIWPETAFPGILPEDQEMMDGLQDFVSRTQLPLLFGAVTKEGRDYYNSAVLLSQSGEIIKQYNKIHLVPFGEFLPLRRQIPFLFEWIPIDDFTAGKEPVVFELSLPSSGKDSQISRFSVLICFEDTVADVPRAMVRKGAQFLVNITNDGWFLKSKASYLHLQASIFQSVSHRRALVRAANTGISAVVHPSGKIKEQMTGPNKAVVDAVGFRVVSVGLNDALSFYTQYGDIFTYLCFGYLLFSSIIMTIQRR